MQNKRVKKLVEREVRQARTTARICFAGRSFVVPAADPYDLDMVLDHSRYLARRHGQVELHIGSRTFQFGADDAAASPA